MPRTRTQTIYRFTELTPAARKVAIEDARRDQRGQELDTEFLYDDVGNVGGILGIEFDYGDTPLHGGGKRRDPAISWQLAYSQGDGASFTGKWTPAPKALEQIKEYAPVDTVLHEIAADLVAHAIDASHPDTGPTPAEFWATLTRRPARGFSGSVHEMSVEIDVMAADAEGNALDVDPDVARALADTLRRFMRWIFDFIREEYESRLSDEYLTEHLEGDNTAEYFASGRRACRED